MRCAGGAFGCVVGIVDDEIEGVGAKRFAYIVIPLANTAFEASCEGKIDQAVVQRRQEAVRMQAAHGAVVIGAPVKTAGAALAIVVAAEGVELSALVSDRNKAVEKSAVVDAVALAIDMVQAVEGCFARVAVKILLARVEPGADRALAIANVTGQIKPSVLGDFHAIT